MGHTSERDAATWRDHIRHHPVVAGAAAGLAWGIVARLWMRFISDHPEFSWSGTAFIVGAATIFGTAMGVAWLRRARGGRGWWRLLGLTVLLLGMGAGSIMIPTVLVGAVALGRPWRRWITAVLLAIALVPQLLLVGPELGSLSVARLVTAVAVYLVLLWSEAAALSIVFRPRKTLGTREPAGAARVDEPVRT